MRTSLLSLLALLITLPTYAQEEYWVVNEGDLVENTTYEVDGETPPRPPTPSDIVLVPAPYTNMVGGTLEIFEIQVELEIGLSETDSLIIHDWFSWAGADSTDLPKDGTIVFRGDGSARIGTKHTPYFGTIVIDKGTNTVTLGRFFLSPDNVAFNAQAIHLESGIFDLEENLIYVQEISQNDWLDPAENTGIIMDNPFMARGRYSVSTDTVNSLFGRITFPTNADTTVTMSYYGQFDQGVEEFKESERYTEEKTPLPHAWRVPGGSPTLTQIFGVTPGDSIEAYTWSNQEFTPLEQKHEPDGSVSVLLPHSASDHILFLVRVNTSTAREDEEIPHTFRLLPPYPNPFNPQVTIPFELDTSQHLRLAVYDALGREVRVLIDEHRPVGMGEVTFEATELPSGTYIVRGNGQYRMVTLVK